MKERSISAYFLLFLKGMAMGAADVVPGVSGGTVAFITGIYEELINSLRKINFGLISKVRKEGVKSAWKHLNGNFLLTLVIGIGISIFSLAKLVSELLINHAVQVWSFFFGLVLASIWLMLKTINKKNGLLYVAILIGSLIAGFISLGSSSAGNQEYWFIFLSGAIAICAMILPGISGAFILVLLGSYQIILNGVKNLDIFLISTFFLGCCVGLIAFSRILHFLFQRVKEVVVSILIGFLIGSLLKIWPWKNSVGEAIFVHSDGREEFNLINVLPANFKGDAFFWQAVIFSLLGLILVLSLEFVGSKLKEKSIQ